jgi:hypothetical protein
MPLMPITITFDQETLPPLLDGLVAAETSLRVVGELLDGIGRELNLGLGGLDAGLAAVETLRIQIDDAVLRAVAGSN